MTVIFLELLKFFKERLKYPIVTLYIILLILWNWDVLSIYFLSDKPIEDRVIYIHKNYEYSHWTTFVVLAKGILLAVLMPLTMLGLEKALHYVNKGRRDIKKDSRIDYLNGQMEIAELERMVQQKRSGTIEVQELQLKVSSLEASLQTQILDNEKHLADISELKAALAKAQTDHQTQLDNFDYKFYEQAKEGAFELINRFENHPYFKGKTFDILLDILEYHLNFRNNLVKRAPHLSVSHDVTRTLNQLEMTEEDTGKLTPLGYMVYSIIKGFRLEGEKNIDTQA